MQPTPIITIVALFIFVGVCLVIPAAYIDSLKDEQQHLQLQIYFLQRTTQRQQTQIDLLTDIRLELTVVDASTAYAIQYIREHSDYPYPTEECEPDGNNGSSNNKEKE